MHSSFFFFFFLPFVVLPRVVRASAFWQAHRQCTLLAATQADRISQLSFRNRILLSVMEM
jgi:hypothetical protein